MKEGHNDVRDKCCPFTDLHSADLSSVGEPTNNCRSSVTRNDNCLSSKPRPEMAATTNKVSMENLVPETGFLKTQRSKRMWQLLGFGACIVAIVMMALLIWQLTSACPTTKKIKSSPPSWPAKEFCPQLPPLVALPSLPMDLRNVLDKIDDYLGLLVNRRTHLPAISANIFYRDTVIWTRHYGRKKLNDPTAPDDSTRYRIGSISKIFPVIMIYKMYEEGVITSLDDPLSKYAPDFHINNPFTGENITLRQIASQMSGLPREAPCVICVRNETTEQQLQLIRNRSLVVEPGTLPSYSNLGYALLGRLLTENPAVNNGTFEAWVEEQILKPLGLNNTGFKITDQVQKNMAFPYDKAGNLQPFMNIGWLSPAGQMYSTITDLAEFGMFLVGAKNQSVLKTRHLREMLAPVNIAPDGQTLWGSPWEMILHKHFLIRAKGGAIDSNAAMLSVVPEIQLGFNVLVNTAVNFSRGVLIANTILDFVYRNFLPVFNKTLVDLSENTTFRVDPKFYIGTYNVTSVDEISGSKTEFQASISSSKYILVYHRKPEHFQHVNLHYIGKKLILQGKRSSPNCMTQQLGSIADFYFEPANSTGLSPRFTVPGWGIRAVRVQTSTGDRMAGRPDDDGRVAATNA